MIEDFNISLYNFLLMKVLGGSSKLIYRENEFLKEHSVEEIDLTNLAKSKIHGLNEVLEFILNKKVEQVIFDKDERDSYYLYDMGLLLTELSSKKFLQKYDKLSKKENYSVRKTNQESFLKVIKMFFRDADFRNLADYERCLKLAFDENVLNFILLDEYNCGSSYKVIMLAEIFSLYRSGFPKGEIEKVSSVMTDKNFLEIVNQEKGLNFFANQLFYLTNKIKSGNIESIDDTIMILKNRELLKNFIIDSKKMEEMADNLASKMVDAKTLDEEQFNQRREKVKENNRTKAKLMVEGAKVSQKHEIPYIKMLENYLDYKIMHSYTEQKINYNNNIYPKLKTRI